MEEQLRYLGPVSIWRHGGGGHVMRRAHHHADLEANLCLAGRAAYLIDGQRIALTADDLLFLHPGQAHLLVDESPDFMMWIVVWRPDAVGAAITHGLDAQAGSQRPTSIAARHLAPETCATLSRLCADVATTTAAVPGGEYLLWRLREAFLAAAEPLSAPTHPAVARAARLIRSDPDLSLAEVADRCALSPDRLGRLFRRNAGMTLVEYRTRTRLALVVGAWTPQRDLLHLALEAGFGSYSAFHRAFRRLYGTTPATGLRQAVEPQRPGRGVST